MKTCSRCKIEKLIDEFNFRDKKKGTRQTYCRVCNSVYLKEHYKRNIKYYVDKAYKNKLLTKQEIKKNLMEYLNTHTCIDCGESDIIVLEFDHIHGEKGFNISEMLCRSHCWGSIRKEIEKCVVRCANCHRRKTSKERGWWKSSD